MELDPQLENLLIRAAGMGASDLHLTVGIPPAVRVNNELIILEDESRLLPADTERLLLGIMDEDHLAAFRTEAARNDVCCNSCDERRHSEAGGASFAAVCY